MPIAPLRKPVRARAAHVAFMRDMKMGAWWAPNTQEVAMNKDLWLGD